MTAPDTFTVLIVTACVATVIATLVVYEHMLREARRERDRAIEHCEQAQALLTAVSRHPSVRPVQHPDVVRLPSLSVVDGGK